MSDGFEARLLLREARQGVLATAAGGEPQAGLVTPATDANLDILLLLSGLSAHTKALEAEASCALLVSGRLEGPNPQTTPRVSVNGRALKLPRGSDEYGAARARYLAVHPYAELYIDFDDFSIWRITPDAALHVAGFGRARKLGGTALQPPPADVEALRSVQSDLTEYAAERFPGLAGFDTDGIDVADGLATVRLSFDRAAAEPEAWRASVTRIATRA